MNFFATDYQFILIIFSIIYLTLLEIMRFKAKYFMKLRFDFIHYFARNIKKKKPRKNCVIRKIHAQHKYINQIIYRMKLIFLYFYLMCKQNAYFCVSIYTQFYRQCSEKFIFMYPGINICALFIKLVGEKSIAELDKH